MKVVIDEMTLNERQKKFAEEYWVSGNGTQSAIKAGYSQKTAYSQAHSLLKKPEIQEYIKMKREEAEAALRQQFSRDAIEARKIMFKLMADDDAPEAVRLSAAKDFLDRAGFKPVEKQEHSGSLDISNKSDVINKYLKGDAE